MSKENLNVINWNVVWKVKQILAVIFTPDGSKFIPQCLKEVIATKIKIIFIELLAWIQSAFWRVEARVNQNRYDFILHSLFYLP